MSKKHRKAQRGTRRGQASSGNRHSKAGRWEPYIDLVALMRHVEQVRLDPEAMLETVDRARVAAELRRQGVRTGLAADDSAREEKNFAELPQTVKERLLRLQRAVPQHPEAAIRELEEIRKEHPDVPFVYNALGNAHAALGNDSAVLATAQETRRRFPNYLFGKVLLAEYYVQFEQYEKIGTVFGSKFDIQDHVPEGRTVFHSSEIRAFYAVVGLYFAAAGKLARAIWSYWAVNKLEPGGPAALRLARAIVVAEIENIFPQFRQRGS